MKLQHDIERTHVRSSHSQMQRMCRGILSAATDDAWPMYFIACKPSRWTHQGTKTNETFWMFLTPESRNFGWMLLGCWSHWIWCVLRAAFWSASSASWEFCIRYDDQCVILPRRFQEPGFMPLALRWTASGIIPPMWTWLWMFPRPSGSLVYQNVWLHTWFGQEDLRQVWTKSLPRRELAPRTLQEFANCFDYRAQATCCSLEGGENNLRHSVF